jgi:hypothetical protein
MEARVDKAALAEPAEPGAMGEPEPRVVTVQLATARLVTEVTVAKAVQPAKEATEETAVLGEMEEMEAQLRERTHSTESSQIPLTSEDFRASAVLLVEEGFQGFPVQGEQQV